MKELTNHLTFLIKQRLVLKVKIVQYSLLTRYYERKIQKTIYLTNLKTLFKESLYIKNQQKLSFYETFIFLKFYAKQFNLELFSIKKLLKSLSLF
jgi:hypothetical protein